VQHCSPEQLALAALREPLPAEDTSHLAGCAACRAEVASLQRGVDALAVPALAAPGPPVPPPPRVWDAIAAATGVSTSPREEPAAAEVVELPVRRRPRRWLPLAAAVLVGGVVGAGVVTLHRNDGSVVAETTLSPLATDDASGRAEVRQRDGLRSLQVDLKAPPLPEGYYEVWVMQPDAVRMVPVGVVHRGDTVLPLPDGLDLGAYPVVDVSVEPLDGNPAHSGLSVARGQLQR
jgi:Anti-sigma-K factor rskA